MYSMNIMQAENWSFKIIHCKNTIIEIAITFLQCNFFSSFSLIILLIRPISTFLKADYLSIFACIL